MERNVLVFVNGVESQAYVAAHPNARFVGFHKAENGYQDIMMYMVPESEAQS